MNQTGQGRQARWEGRGGKGKAKMKGGRDWKGGKGKERGCWKRVVLGKGGGVE
jgi:hypothetical protein